MTQVLVLHRLYRMYVRYLLCFLVLDSLSFIGLLSIFFFFLMFLLFFFFFFFSSRRRHTRWPRDWSSDVCSSDLFTYRSSARRSGEDSTEAICKTSSTMAGGCAASSSIGSVEAASVLCLFASRSEERRVGKECRYRWARYH